MPQAPQASFTRPSSTPTRIIRYTDPSTDQHARDPPPAHSPRSTPHDPELAELVLARAVVDGIDFHKARCVVELSAGTGPITAESLRRVPPSCRVLIVERDPDFCVRLRERFPQADVAQADALDLDRLFDARGLNQVDHFFCGLPLPSFPAQARDGVPGGSLPLRVP